MVLTEVVVLLEVVLIEVLLEVVLLEIVAAVSEIEFDFWICDLELCQAE